MIRPRNYGPSSHPHRGTKRVPDLPLSISRHCTSGSTFIDPCEPRLHKCSPQSLHSTPIPGCFARARLGALPTVTVIQAPLVTGVGCIRSLVSAFLSQRWRFHFLASSFALGVSHRCLRGERE